MTRVILQALLGLVMVLAGFVGGTMLCEFCIPGTGVKYLNKYGESIVGALIFAVMLATALLARFDTRTLFITAGLVPALIIGLALFAHSVSPSYGSGGVNWHGLVRDTLFVSRHTALPVMISAATVLVIRVVHAQRGAAPNGSPGMPTGKSGVSQGPPSVS